MRKRITRQRNLELLPRLKKKKRKLTAQQFIGLDSLYTYLCCRKVQIFITLYVRILMLLQCLDTNIFALLFLGMHTEMFKELQFLTLKWVEVDYFAMNKNICCSLCSFIGLHWFLVLLRESRNNSPMFHVTN